MVCIVGKKVPGNSDEGALSTSHDRTGPYSTKWSVLSFCRSVGVDNNSWKPQPNSDKR